MFAHLPDGKDCKDVEMKREALKEQLEWCKKINRKISLNAEETPKDLNCLLKSLSEVVSGSFYSRSFLLTIRFKSNRLHRQYAVEMAGYMVHRGRTRKAGQFKTWFTGSPYVKALMKEKPQVHDDFLHKVYGNLM